MDDFDFTDYTDILPDDVSQTGTNPVTGGGVGDTSWLDAFKNFGNAAKNLINPNGPFGAFPLFGLAALANQSKFFNPPPTKVGFQGTIPQYTATRQQLPYQTGQANELLRLKQAAQDAMSTGATQDQVREAAMRTYGISPSQFDQAMQSQGTYRRPGLGGITYFSPMQYTKGATAPAAGGISDLVDDRGERRRPLAAPSTPATSTTQPPKLAVPAPGTPERAAYEQRLAGQMTQREFEELKANPNSVLSPTFNAALEANLRGEEELRRRGIPSVFGSEFTSTNPADIRKWTEALMIQRPMGGHLTNDIDLNMLLEDYMASALAGDVSRARGAYARMEQLGLGGRNINAMVSAIDPEFSDKIYRMNFDETTKTARGPLGYTGFESYFTPGSGGWKLIAQDQARYGLRNEDIARGMGMSVEEVERNLSSVPSIYKQWPPPPGMASGGYMPGGIAMLSKGRYLKGNGDGVSDSIPARFSGSGQEARLADGEFVVPARVVSELGNGSSDAGARKLYAMLDRVEARAKKAKRGKPSGADTELKRLA